MTNSHNLGKSQVFSIGILGNGYFAGKVINQVINSEKIKILGVASKSGNKFQTQIPHVPMFDSYEKLLSLKPDCLYICNILPSHYDSIRNGLEANIPTLCEKPIVRTLSELKILNSLSTDMNCFLSEALWINCLSHTQRIYQLIDQGFLGKIKKIEVFMSKSLNRQKSARVFDRWLSGGALFDYTIHALNFSLRIFGPSLVLSNLDEVKTSGNSESEGEYSLRFMNGDSLLINYSILSARKNFIKIVGELGVLVIKGEFLNPSEIRVTNAQGMTEIPIDNSSKYIETLLLTVHRDLEQGNKTSSISPLEFTFKAIEILDLVNSYFNKE